MKVPFLTCALVVLLAGCPGVARTQAGTDQDQQIAIKQLETDQRAIIALNLGLTDRESRLFWPIYDEYETAMKKVIDQRVQLLNAFAARYPALTDADADAMLQRLWKSEDQALRIREKYTRKIQGVLPSVKALRYVQLQARLDNELLGWFMSNIPLAR